jgi:hypothetical protein
VAGSVPSYPPNCDEQTARSARRTIGRSTNPLPDRNGDVTRERAAVQLSEEPGSTLRKPDQPLAPPFIASRPAEVTPLAPERYKIQFTINRETHEQLCRAQSLLRHTISNGDPAAIFERALALLVTELERGKLAAAIRPRHGCGSSSHSRHIPASVRRAVWHRDGERCAFKGAQGRCTETGFLEFHHVVPFAAGGETTAENLELRCRAHNAYEAEQNFGSRQPSHVREVPDPSVEP